MFLSGVEIDFGLLRRMAQEPGGKRLFGATLLYVAGVLAIGLAVGFVLTALRLAENSWIIALILSTCSVGVVVPTLKERRLSSTEYGQTILVTALLLDFITMLLLAAMVIVATTGNMREIALVGLLFVAVLLTYLGGDRLRRKPFMRDLAHATSQIGVRGAFMLIFLFSFLSDLLGAEVILGAFLAGAIVSLISESDETSLHLKLDAIGYGFLVPIFFIMVGAEFDLAALAASPSSLALAPLIIVGAYLAKTVPGAVFAPRFGIARSAGLAVLATPGLSLTVAAAEIGYRLGLLSASTHSAMILLAIVTAAVSPILFGRIVPPGPAAGDRKIVIVGANERGLVLAARLSDYRESLVMVDRNPDRVANAEKRGFRAVRLDAASADEWRRLDLDPNTTVVITTQEDALNVKAAEILRSSFEVGAVVCQVNNPDYVEVLDAIDVHAVTPAFSTISVMENVVRHPGLFSLLNHEDEHVSIEEVTLTNTRLAGRPVRELPLPGDTLILSIRRGREHIIPRGETRVQLHDILTLSGTPDEVKRTLEVLGRH